MVRGGSTAGNLDAFFFFFLSCTLSAILGVCFCFCAVSPATKRAYHRAPTFSCVKLSTTSAQEFRVHLSLFRLSVLPLQHGQVGGLRDDHPAVRLHALLAHLLLFQQLLLARDVPAAATSTGAPSSTHSHQQSGPRQSVLSVGAQPTCRNRGWPPHPTRPYSTTQAPSPAVNSRAHANKRHRQPHRTPPPRTRHSILRARSWTWQTGAPTRSPARPPPPARPP